MRPLRVVAAVLVTVVVVVYGRQGDAERREIIPIPFKHEPPPQFPLTEDRPDFHHVLYSIGLSPGEINLRDRGPGGPEEVPDNPEPLRYMRDRSPSGPEEVPANPEPLRYVFPHPIEPENSFSKSAIQAHPHRSNKITRYFSPFPEGDVDYHTSDLKFQRGGVEHVPIEAMQYMAREDEVEEEEDGAFSRSAVESYPRFPLPYSGGVEDEVTGAVVIEASEALGQKYGWAGIRNAVESPPLWTPAQEPDEASPLPVQLNSRPYGIWSEELLGFAKADEFDTNYGMYYETEHSDLDSVAGGDYLQYRADVRKKNGDYKLLCYYGGWSVYRPPPFDFGIKDIDPFSCTHLIYSFAGLKAGTLTITELDHEVDIVQGGYKAAVGLKQTNPNLKVLIAIGGWNEGGKKYSEMANTKMKREKFIQSTVTFLKTHQFDGLDLDWEYPGASDRGGRWGDKKNFADLVDELHAAFQPHGWLLTAAVSPAGFRVNEGYDVPRLAAKLDFINIMTYDLRGPWDGKADHHAPIESRPTDPWTFQKLNTKDGIRKWLESGAPAEKLIMGIPFYGRTFTLASQGSTKPGVRATSGGIEGKYTKERGFLAYYEVCELVKSGQWKLEKDAVGGPYISKGNQWIGYDDQAYVLKKMDLVKTMGLGGAMTWAIDLDDYLGVCGTKWPLLTAMRTGLGIRQSVSMLPDTPAPNQPVPPLRTTTTTTTTTTTKAPVVTQPSNSMVYSP